MELSSKDTRESLEASLAEAEAVERHAAEQVNRWAGIREDAIKIKKLCRDRLALLPLADQGGAAAGEWMPTVGEWVRVTGGRAYVGEVAKVTQLLADQGVAEIEVPGRGSMRTIVEIRHLGQLS